MVDALQQDDREQRQGDAAGASPTGRSDPRDFSARSDGSTLQPFPAPLPARRTGAPVEQRPWEIEAPARFLEPTVPPLPTTQAGGSRLLWISFLLLFVVPSAVVGFYYYFVAQDLYQSEFRFSVSQGNPVIPGTAAATSGSSSGAMSSITSLLGGGASGPSQQNFIVVDYATSRAAVDELEKRVHVRSFYTKDSIDWWERFNNKLSNDAFWKYFKGYLTSSYDQVTGLAFISVQAYSAADAHSITSALSDMSDKLINDINNRANQDAIKSAYEEDRKAELSLKDANERLTQFRSTEGTVNPANGIVAINTSLAQTLQSNLIGLQTRLNSALAQGLSQASAVARDLKAQINAATSQLLAVENQIARSSGKSLSLALVQGKYDQLVFEQQFAQLMASQTRQALLIARASAAAQHLYLEPYVMPSYPEIAEFPSRGLDTFLWALLFFGLWFGCIMIYKAIDDHRG